MLGRLAAITILALAAIPLAQAQTGPSEGGRAAYGRFKALDRDGDRALSRAELLSRGHEHASQTLFQLLDRDGNGAIAFKEMEHRGEAGRLGRFEAYDLNKDGVVTRKEFPVRLDPYLVKALDADRDGTLALAEAAPRFAGTRPRVAAEQAQRPRPTPDPMPRTWCWVPAIGDDGWGLEAPVLATRCRVSLSHPRGG